MATRQARYLGRASRLNNSGENTTRGVCSVGSPKFTHLYNEWVRMYEEGNSTYKIAEIYGCTVQAVRDALVKQGVKMRPCSMSKYDCFQEDWVNKYRSGYTIEQIAQEYQCSYTAVRKRLIAWGVGRRSRSEASRKYQISEEDFFAVINTQEKAYWLGFLMADGCVRRTGNSFKIEIDLKADDRVVLRLFLNAIGADYSIRYYRHHTSGNEMCKVGITSANMAMDLIKHGCVPRKSHVLKFPNNIPGGLIPHFIRGYFDGDGTLCLGRNIRWSLVGSYEFLAKIQDIMVTTLGLRRTKLYKKPQKHVWDLSYTGKHQVALICDWLYKDAEIYLPRKYERYKKVLNLGGSAEFRRKRGVGYNGKTIINSWY